MSTLKKLRKIMKANVNSFLGKFEDPEKMIDQELEDVEKALYQVKARTASVMAEEKRIEREIANVRKEIEDAEKYATIAVTKEEEENAIKYLSKKKELEVQLEELEKAHESAVEDTAEMRKLHDEHLVAFKTLKNKQNVLKTKATVAKTRAARNNYISNKENGVHSTMENFKRLEDKINTMLDESEATKLLENSSPENELALVSARYEKEIRDEAIRKELETLKKASGM